MTNDWFDWPPGKRRTEAENLERLLLEAFNERTRNLRRQREIAQQRLAQAKTVSAALKELSASTKTFAAANGPEKREAMERCLAAVEKVRGLISDQGEI